MHNELIGYLLGALDASEHLAIDQHLESSAEARLQLEILRRCLLPLEIAFEECAVPDGLARRTCLRIRAEFAEPSQE